MFFRIVENKLWTFHLSVVLFDFLRPNPPTPTRAHLVSGSQMVDDVGDVTTVQFLIYDGFSNVPGQ